jgi:hypothetical protein
MKKFLLVATMCVAGLASANNLEKNKEDQPKKVEQNKDAETPPRQLCTAITIVIMCDTSQNFNNTYCWEEGNQASFESAIHCYETEHQMFNDEICN